MQQQNNFFRLGKEAEDESLFRPRTSMIEENFIAPKKETIIKGIFGPRLDAQIYIPFFS